MMVWFRVDTGPKRIRIVGQSRALCLLSLIGELSSWPKVSHQRRAITGFCPAESGITVAARGLNLPH